MVFDVCRTMVCTTILVIKVLDSGDNVSSFGIEAYYTKTIDMYVEDYRSPSALETLMFCNRKHPVYFVFVCVTIGLLDLYN